MLVVSFTNFIVEGGHVHKRILSAVLAALLMNLVCYAQRQVGPKTKEDEEADKIFASVFPLSLEPGTLVKVRLRDGTELKGYIIEANVENFSIVPPESQSVTKLRYQQVKDVKRYRSRGRKIGSFIGYAGLIYIIVGMAVGYARK
jgi:hypothetical protein